MQTLAQSPAPSAHARHAPRPAAGTRWAPAALALLLAACVHSPQAAVTAPAQPLTGAALNAAAGCQETPAARAALQAVTQAPPATRPLPAGWCRCAWWTA